MDLLYWIIIFSLLGGVVSVIAASVFLLLPESWRTRLLPHFVSYAIGALLAAAFLALLPHSMNEASVDFHQIGLTVLLGILGFFLLEKMVLWRHCHSSHCEAHSPDEAHKKGSDQSVVTLILVGDGLHNFVDGVLIAAAFMTDIHLGVVTSIAVATHEIPQEVGDFAILLHSGMSRLKAFIMNVSTSITTLIGALLAYVGLSGMESLIPFILAIAASSFIYIAMADLLPGLHKKTQLSATIKQILLIVMGVITIYAAHSSLH
jgi:zinc and cadmium transporter